jgi:hypothetical protein
MEDVRTDPQLIARCGLYCGACGRFRKGRCPGCSENTKASWCKVRSCCGEHGYASCAECATPKDPRACRKFNNLIARLFGLVFNSDRAVCIERIRRLGPDGYAAFMATHRLQSLPRRGPRPE